MTFYELYMSGSTFLDFINQDDKINQQKILEIYQGIYLEEETLHKIQLITKPIYILAFAEIWCPDCMINLPALEKIKSLNGMIDFRILPREGYEVYMEAYTINGKAKIPTFVIFNDDFHELGVFVEMPKSLKSQLYNGNQVEIVVAKRKYRRGEFVKETIKEILSFL